MIKNIDELYKEISSIENLSRVEFKPVRKKNRSILDRIKGKSNRRNKSTAITYDIYVTHQGEEEDSGMGLKLKLMKHRYWYNISKNNALELEKKIRNDKQIIVTGNVK